MQKVRFTVDEIKGNIRFIFWLCSFTIIALIVSQVRLIQLEKTSYNLQKEWTKNEAFITSFQNAFYTTHDVQFAITKEYATTNAHALRMFDDPVIQNGPYKEELEKWKGALEYVLDSRGYNGMKDHDHQKCIGLNAKKNYIVNQARLTFESQLEGLQRRIDLLNLIILLLPVVTLAFLVYTAFFTNYGGTE